MISRLIAGLLVLAAGSMFSASSTSWVKQNPLPLEYQLTSAHFNSYNRICAIDSLHQVAFGYDSVYLSTSDGGTTWEPKAVSGLHGVPVGEKVSGAGKIIVAGHVFWKNTAAGALFRTSDTGRNWTSVPLPVKNENPVYSYNVANVFIADSQNYYLLAYRHPDNGFNWEPYLVRSNDGGSTWAESVLPQASMYASDLCFSDTSTGWFVSMNSLWNTVDGGMTWKERPLNGYNPSKICFVSKSKGWMVGAAILRTIDGGKTWKQQRPECPQQMNIKFIDSTKGWIQLADSRIIHTRDGGVTWNYQYTYGKYSGQIVDAVFFNPMLGWAVGNNGLILRTAQAPSPMIDNQFAQKSVNYLLRYPGYYDSLFYTFKLHYGPAGMTISSGGTIQWVPAIDTFAIQKVELIVTDSNGLNDSVFFSINVNNDKRPFTGVSGAGKGSMTGRNGIAVSCAPSGSYRFHAPAGVRAVTVTNLRGAVVATLRATDAVALGGSEFIWHQSGNAGKRPGAGVYVVRAVLNGKILTRQFTVSH